MSVDDFSRLRRTMLLGSAASAVSLLSACGQSETASNTPLPESHTGAPTEEDIAARPSALNSDYPPAIEVQCGDEDIQSERIWIDPASVLGGLYRTRATYSERLPTFGERLLQVATRFLDYSRETHPQEIERMLQLYGLSLRDSAGRYVPYCAAGVSYCGALAYLEELSEDALDTTQALKPLMGELEHYHFYPSPSVLDMYNVARGKRQWRDEADKPTPRPGWLVAFDFIGRPSHVGIVEDASADRITTIEFNTRPQGAAGSQRNGGAVARRSRPRNARVLGYIATDLRPPWT